VAYAVYVFFVERRSFVRLQKISYFYKANTYQQKLTAVFCPNFGGSKYRRSNAQCLTGILLAVSFPLAAPVFPFPSPFMDQAKKPLSLPRIKPYPPYLSKRTTVMTEDPKSETNDRMQEIVSLCKRRGFVFQSSEIYGGLKSCYDYGPLGIELKRNLMNEWWRSMVHEREDVYGLDASIIMKTDVWKASGHLGNFSDPMVDCHLCKERFRADKAPQVPAGTELTLSFSDKGKAKVALTIVHENHLESAVRSGKTITGPVASDRGYVCPICSSPYLSAERAFNLMFRTSIGPVDPINAIAEAIEKNAGEKPIQEVILKTLNKHSVYLRPETAQAMFVQFMNVQHSMSAKVPFGIAQMGKSFRNEITVEHFIFRSCEFEQMEMEYFIEPGTQDEMLEYWCQERMKWWRRFANDPDSFRLREHTGKELAHYASGCYDVEYKYPWGWDELEGVASRTDYDLKAHMAGSKKKIQYLDTNKEDPETGKAPWKYVPYVIEPAAGATRGMLCFLLDAYTLDHDHIDEKGRPRTLLRLHPRLAPVKCAVLPLIKKDGLPEIAQKISGELFAAGINSKLDMQHQIGRRYRRHDEIGTPYALTIDHQTLEDQTVTIRDRDTTKQERIPMDKAVEIVRERIASY
jgi:glycyl-tRNA synthetase